MSEPQIPLPVKLIISILFNPEPECASPDVPPEVLTALTEQFGPLDLQTPVHPFTRTTYYQPEMGTPLLRTFLSFSNLVARDRLADIKLYTNQLEKTHSREDGTRRINVDPGLLTMENLILASGKNFTHRIYLRNGIFAEITLLFQNRNYIDLPWTYPDYAATDVKSFLRQVRARLAEDLKTDSRQ
ncbi:DUF4416 family protein [Thermodesulfobacteriota bacterium]